MYYIWQLKMINADWVTSSMGLACKSCWQQL